MDQNTEPVIDTEAALAELVDRGLVEVIPGDDPGPDGYETTLGAEIGEILARTGPLDPDAVHSYSASTITSQGTLTADVAQIRADAARTFRVDGDEDLPSGVTSTGDKLDVDLAKNRPEADARVLRVLAARIARAGVRGNEDPLLTLTDIAAAVRSLNVAVARLGGAELSDEDDPESFKIYAETLDHLRHAADGVAEIAGWV